MKHSTNCFFWSVLVLSCLSAQSLFSLDPHRAITQYARTVWTQAQGLPQDTVRSLAQTPDGYLWVGTKEGLARFDGYDFVSFTREHGELPNNIVGKLLAAADGTLWIGTAGGLAHYSKGEFERFTAPGDPANGPVTSIAEDHTGGVWVVCDGKLYHREHGRFAMISRENLAAIGALQSVHEDRHHTIWVGGSAGVMKLAGASFVKVLGVKELAGSFITALIDTDQGLWAGGTKGILVLHPDGTWRRYTTADGLPNNFVLAMLQDRAGNLWVGTYGGLSRLDEGRFVSFPADNKDDRDWVWSLLEDRECNLWVGMNGGLNRLRDNLFNNYGQAEGLPADDPYVVHQDRRGVIWVGYHDSGLVALTTAGRRKRYTTRDGLPSNEIFAISDTKSGDLLISTRNGLARMRNGRFTNEFVLDNNGRTAVYDALEDRRGNLWAATARGIYKRTTDKWAAVVPESAGDAAYAVTLAEGLDGSMWAGTLNAGIWRIRTDNTRRLFTRADGLNETQIRTLYQDPNGALWIGTFGGGLNEYNHGAFSHVQIKDGLSSDNIANILDDGRGHLWLSTTHGISRVSKRELADLAAHKITTVHPENYGLDDGLRNAQCAPASPASQGSARTADGRLWFPTMHNLAVIDSADPTPAPSSPVPPPLHLLQVSADGRPVTVSRFTRIDPGVRRLEIRYVGVSLAAPERIRYSYRLDGLEKDWSPPTARRIASYSPMPHGHYRFLVRASTPGGAVSETSWDFEVVPWFYERLWFICLAISLVAATVWGAYRIRMKHLRDRLTLIYEERARLAREIHDTLAQGFVGISAQLDVVAMELGGDVQSARQHLNLARKMAQHSLTEARRSVMNLRAGELETSDLSSILTAAAHRWAAGSSLDVHVEVGDLSPRLPEEIEQNLLRIAQEAVTNAVKHARASEVRIELRREQNSVFLCVRDDGKGFEPPVRFSVVGGHFGILGMRERAEKLRAQFSLDSSPGRGTHVEVTIPLALNGKRNV